MSLHPALKSALLLGAFGVVGTALVTFVHEHTRERIAANERAASLASLHEILPSERYDNALLEHMRSLAIPGLTRVRPAHAYIARRGDEPVAAIFDVVTPEGYGGPIRLLIGVDRDGTVAGVRVVSHEETPNLGAAISQARSDWILGFTGRALGDPPRQQWNVAADGGVFDQFTGATVSPRAVVEAVKRVLVYFDTNKDALFQPAQDAR